MRQTKTPYKPSQDPIDSPRYAYDNCSDQTDYLNRCYEEEVETLLSRIDGHKENLTHWFFNERTYNYKFLWNDYNAIKINCESYNKKVSNNFFKVSFNEKFFGAFILRGNSNNRKNIAIVIKILKKDKIQFANIRKTLKESLHYEFQNELKRCNNEQSRITKTN